MTLRVLMFIVTIAGVLLSFAIILTVFLGKKVQDPKGRQKLNLWGKIDLEVNTLVMLLALGIIQTLAPIGVMAWKPELVQPVAPTEPWFLNITGTAVAADENIPPVAESITVTVTRADSVIMTENADPTEGFFAFQGIPIKSQTDKFQVKAEQGSRRALKDIQITLHHVKLILR